MNNFLRGLIVLSFILICLPAQAGLLDQVTPITEPSGVFSDQFGSTVAISSDGVTLLAAAPAITWPAGLNYSTGIVYPIQYINGVWSNPLGGFGEEPSYLDSFGTSLALSADGTTAYAGFSPLPSNPASTSPFVAYTIPLVSPSSLFNEFTDPSAQPFSAYGNAGAISGDGTTVLIGAPATQVGAISAAGEAYIYSFNAGTATWGPPTTIPDPDGTAGDNFGSNVALSADGKSALIGTFAGSGKVYLYINIAGTWTQVQTFTGVNPSFDIQDTLAISANGQKIIFISNTLNSVAVYTETVIPTTWVGTTISPAGVLPYMVAMSADGNAVVIGGTSDVAGGPGAALLYTVSGGIWSLSNTFTDPAPDPSSFTGFGSNGVAISADKETVVVGAGNATVSGHVGSGLVYAYQSSADLSLAMTASPAIVSLGQQVTLNATVTNTDLQATAYNVSLTDILPAGLTYLGASAAGGSCSVSGQTVSCTLASLAPGAVWQPAITIKVATAGTYSDTASITSNQPDPNTANDSASVTISMLPPTVSDGSVTTVENSAVSGALTGANPCNCGTPVFSVVTVPSHGTVTITNTTIGAFTYTPTAGYYGSDTFTFQQANGLDTSGTATESVTVNALPPTTSSGSVTTVENTAVTNTLSGSNPCSCGAPVFSVVAPPSHGAVTITNANTGAFTYTPTMGYSGNDSFSFKLSNGISTSGTATESITVNSGGGGGGGGGSVDFFALGLLGALLTFVQRRRTRR
ncbi:MAG: Ig-like domain-containing protein [Gammaproteobacteria bacterium]